MQGYLREPLNIGGDELLTINRLVDIIEVIVGITLERQYDTTKPKGINGRNSDYTSIQELLGWQPGVELRRGLDATYVLITARLPTHSRS